MGFGVLPKLNRCLPLRSPAQRSIWSARKSLCLWRTYWTTFCIARMRRDAQALRLAVYSIADLILLHSSFREVLEAISEKNVANYFDTGDGAYKIRWKLLSTNAYMEALAEFIQWRPDKAVATECLKKKMVKQLKAQILDSDVKHVTQKALSPHSRTKSAPTSSRSNEDEDIQSNRCGPEYSSIPATVVDGTEKTSIDRWNQADRPNRTIHRPTLSPTPTRPATRVEACSSRRNTGRMCNVWWTTAYATHWTNTNTALMMNFLCIMAVSQIGLLGR